MKPTGPFRHAALLRLLRAATFFPALAVLMSGCVATKYKMVKKKAAVPPVAVNAAFASAPVEARLVTLITYRGPGAWKRDALWDEYVVTLRNPGGQPLEITSATLADHAGLARAPGTDPWKLEKESKVLERRYRDSGMAFVRTAGPGVLIVGAGAAAVASVGIGMGGTGAAAAGIATTTLVALPVYYITVYAINSSNKAATTAEFDRRRLQLPLTLKPGEERTGSLFFPMIASPRALKVGWQRVGEGGEAVLSLEFLKNLHLKAPAPADRPAASRGTVSPSAKHCEMSRIGV